MGQETVYHDNGKIIVSEDFMREVLMKYQIIHIVLVTC